ncbi:MAG TPA: nuclear transport factor 2 family protein [Jatrophihabitantaceae bacterium]
MSEVRAAVVEHVAAFNAHDTTRLLAGLAPDAVWITGQDTAVGRSALGELFDDWLWSLDPHLETIRMAVDGDTAAAELRESLTVDGTRRQFSIAAFLTVTGGLITRGKIYREGSADL